jgi:hypothetical protein
VAVGTFPEGDETEDFLGLFAFAQVGIGIAEGAPVGVLRQEGQYAWLPATTGQKIDSHIYYGEGNSLCTQRADCRRCST